MWPQLQVLLSKLHSNLQSTGKTFSARQDKNLAHQTKAYRWGEGRGNNAFFTLYSHCVSQSTSSIKSSPSLNWKSHATEILLNEHQAFTAKALLLLRDAGEAAMVPSRIFMAKGKHLFLSALKQSGFQNKLVKIHREICSQGQLTIRCACKLSSSQVEILHKEKTDVEISRQRNKHVWMFYIHFLLLSFANFSLKHTVSVQSCSSQGHSNAEP